MLYLLSRLPQIRTNVSPEQGQDWGALWKRHSLGLGVKDQCHMDFCSSFASVPTEGLGKLIDASKPQENGKMP